MNQFELPQELKTQLAQIAVFPHKFTRGELVIKLRELATAIEILGLPKI